MSFFDSFWSDDAHDVCVDLTEPAAIATGAIWSPAGPEVSGIMSGFVLDGWHDVCDLPTNLANDFGFGSSSDDACSSVGEAASDSGCSSE